MLILPAAAKATTLYRRTMSPRFLAIQVLTKDEEQSRTWRPTREEWPRVSEDQRLLCICQALKREELRKSQRQNPPENEKGTMTELRTTDTAIMTDVTSTSIQADTQYRDSLEKNLCRLREENAELRDHASQVKKVQSL